MNVISQNIEKNPLIIFLNKLMGDSFEKEKAVYNKLGIKVEHPRSLDTQKCKEIYDKLFNTDKFDILLNILRNEQFYQRILSLFSSQIDALTKAKIGKITNLSSEIKTEINKKFEEESANIQSLQNNNNCVLDMKEIVSIIKNKLEDIIQNESNSEKTKEIGQMLYNIIIKIDENEINGQYKLTISDKNKTIKWNKSTTENFLKELSQKTGVKIITEYYIIEPNTNIDDIDMLKDDLINFILKVALEMGIKDDQKKLLNNILKDKIFQNTIKNYLKNKAGKNLIIGSKTIEKIKGDLGEFLSTVLIDYALNLSVSFGGDVQTSTGEAAVDIFIKKMGFQIKNFPRSENTNNPISLYPDQFFINPKNNKDRRAMTGEEQNLLYKNSILLARKTTNKKDEKIEAKEIIRMLLTKTFPNFIRYSQNFYSDISLTNSFKKITNNFYIINFRAIPASRIFYELIQQIKNNFENDNNGIEKYFYLTKETITYTSTSKKKNFFESFSDPNISNLFKYNQKSVNLVFRGIQINYSGLRAGDSNGNLLSESFKGSKLI